MSRITRGLLLTFLAALPQGASAMITGGEGNKALRDPGWPAGAAAIFNHSGRIAWWEGPPFGGGQWHAECRGDTRALNAVLADFARMDTTVKRLVIHDGTGRSFWLAPNREREKRKEARIDWAFTVWQPDRWAQLRQLPADLNPTAADDASPPSQLDVYTANLGWAAVVVPKGITVIDNRLVAHGFTPEDGIVIEGTVTDLATKQPIAATMRLQRVEPQDKGGYHYPVVAKAKADAQGHWVRKHVPAGWLRVIVEADGYAPRVAGFAQFDEQPRWQSFACGLARLAAVSGRVVDEAGKPLEGAEVRLGNVQAESGGRYESPLESTVRTDAEGRFRAEQIPVGTASVWVNKPGYYGPGLGLPITTPKADVALKMMRAASVRVTVDFTGKKRPEGYIASMKPEGGEVVGSYGGSGNIDARNQMSFEIVPPGRYIFTGRPNPGSDAEETDPITVELVGGQAAEVTLKAK
ncbi:carboxypeptidase-like regulatory domain-containing protein [Singulisphaera sp. Ch08]|uniref:Carboxypeptidase-like regulatory domain-containing protein n=1 Tax=Singulisphaera sp. Ch08 TaxID=3120278 RepID=A0AAU7C811_9BACT